MTNVRTSHFENAPALSIREDGRELRKLMRDVLGKPKRQKPKPGTPEHRRALALKLVAMRERGGT
jgi:hypothetical protein